VVLEPTSLNLDIWLTLIEHKLSRVDTSRPPHFDVTNFSYWSARMACYLEVVDIGILRATHGGMKR
jgi:hypothetical protein